MTTRSMLQNILMGFLFACSAAGEAMGATLIVDNTTDSAALTACTAAPNDCSLRGAINTAASGDIVTFDSGAFSTPRLIKLSGNALFVSTNLTITGVGGVIIDGNNASRVFTIFGAITVNMSGMTVTGGNSDPPGGNFISGGGISSNGSLTLTNMNVIGNVSNNAGGGVFNTGNATLNIINSNVSDNVANGGGGIFNNSGTLMVTGSTIAGNSAGSSGGGGIYNAGSATITNSAIIANSANGSVSSINPTFGGGINGSATIANSTISGNRISNIVNQGFGGGINGGGTWTNVTITNNSANTGGGVNVSGSTIMTNSIVAGNTATTNPDINNAFTSQGNNLVQNRGTSSGYIASDLPNGTDPLLDVLKNNGGSSPTHALLSGSPAIDAGNNTFAIGPNDQRGPGFARIVGAAVDIGAFERGSVTAALVDVGGRVVTADGRGLRNAIVVLTSQSGFSRRATTSSFGYYRVNNLQPGETYVLSVSSKHFQFSPQIVSVNDNLAGLNFTAIK